VRRFDEHPGDSARAGEIRWRSRSPLHDDEQPEVVLHAAADIGCVDRLTRDEGNVVLDRPDRGDMARERITGGQAGTQEKRVREIGIESRGRTTDKQTSAELEQILLLLRTSSKNASWNPCCHEKLTNCRAYFPKSSLVLRLRLWRV
jgi:hypothetical protein